MYNKIIAGIVLSLLSLVAGIEDTAAQKTVKGVVMEEDEKGGISPLIGVNVAWSGTSVGTVTDVNGVFNLKTVPETDLLSISYVGYESDTLKVTNTESLRIILKHVLELESVSIEHRRKTTSISLLNPLHVQTLSEGELFKAACCNLSESFETNPSVDVTFSDAVTGTKQIQMLGLSGVYTQIQTENIPSLRGLIANLGLTYIPGTRLESVQLTKGIGSVVNGYESITGQINLELKKPDVSDKLYLNAYGNAEGRTEMNLQTSHRIGPHWSTGVMLHGSGRPVKIDRNGDGFLENPLGYQINVLNRWKFDNHKGFHTQFGFGYLKDEKTGGEFDFDPTTDRGTKNAYGFGIDAQRFDAFGKFGYVFPKKKYKSIGLIWSFADHRWDSYFGLNNYDALERSVYTNLIYQSIIGNTNHKFRTGLSFMHDLYDETVNLTNYKRSENVPGAFFEYTYAGSEKFNMILGARVDYNNLFGVFFTPRLHTRYSITDKTSLRASAGRGQRTANIFAENISLLASSRTIEIKTQDTEKAYGLNPETAWNFGVNLTHEFRLDYREGSVSIDYFRTEFTDRVVVDRENSQQAVFYNLNGQSYANSLQIQAEYELFKQFDVRLAYRWFDVKTTFNDALLAEPFVSRHRAFTNLAYETRNGWKFDYTVNWFGPKRIPNTSSNPAEFQLAEFSPDFFAMNAQITKSFKGKLDIYLGAENFLNFRQADPILSANNPFGPYFDSSLIWGPVFGRMIYGGLRFKIKRTQVED